MQRDYIQIKIYTDPFRTDSNVNVPQQKDSILVNELLSERCMILCSSCLTHKINKYLIFAITKYKDSLLN